MFLPVIPLADVVPVIVVVGSVAECPPGAVILPSVVVPPGVDEVAAPPVQLTSGSGLVCVVVIAPPDVVPAVIAGAPPVAPPVAPRPAATGNGGLAQNARSSVPPWAAGLFLVGVAILAVATRNIVGDRAER